MLTTHVKELEQARAKVSALEEQINAELTAELKALPGKYGFESVQAFVAAVRAAAGGKKAGKGSKRRTRAVITDATRSEVKKLVDAGKTGGEIAKIVGISLPSVQNIKKALGLVKKRGK